MLIKIKLAIAKIVCGIVPYKHINGRWYRLPSGVSRAFWPWMRHSVEPHELEAVRNYGVKSGVYLDVGANVGLLTLAMRAWAGPTAHIYAIEPNPQAYDMLGKVMSMNRINPSGLWSLAVADHCGTVKFKVSQRDALGVMSSIQGNDPDGIEVEVPCMTIDSLCSKWEQLNYIKIDVEGAEVLVLSGALVTLAKLRPIVQVEVHGPFLRAFGHSIEQLFDLMTGCGYDVINVVTSEPTTAAAFNSDTALNARHPLTGENMRYLGYGHVVFKPKTIGAR